jgi:hypothetical protein
MVSARLTAEQAAWVLNCQPHDVPVLVAAWLLNPMDDDLREIDINKVIVALTVQEILDDNMAKKLV